MKTLGLIGGMSWESTIPYYRIINEIVKDRLGGLHSARIILYSVEFAEIEKCQSTGDWARCGEIMADAAVKLQQAGADYIVICANTMHKLVPDMLAKLHIPIIHIADATAEMLKKQGIKKAALLGTKYTMTQDFYKQRLIDNGLEVVVPEADDITLINDVIYNELCRGEINESSRRKCAEIIGKLKSDGAEGVILGCTEIGLLVRAEDSVLPVFDTTVIHAQKAAEMALEG
ncbi:MAG: aspartate/glutamate racemase family protein [Selenomonadaceae bacterium]|nr:aspartate/glutamate racemase family protein [Selenomonadaceae bacterium]MBQ2410835.1 aspartate/glutamate racemase family protein [Selenomonadaceae bacterium]MBQ5586577.1 aspartate/glutamate racemase family protein [Selenomonadaceae bacterium]MBQ5732828.1 aspartate/glutamate racemase family protein [Selenomonadaceae bacterium]MBQ5846971.1 aspartate/glutamate racemase family protein [Selenomonadaceae bacterium]